MSLWGQFPAPSELPGWDGGQPIDRYGIPDFETFAKSGVIETGPPPGRTTTRNGDAGNKPLTVSFDSGHDLAFR